MSNEYVINKDGQRLHRKVVEKYLKRPLKPEEIVHHINEDKMDNRIENLIVFETNADHSTFHKKKRTKIFGWQYIGKDNERAMNCFINKYGIVFYGPFFKAQAERERKELIEKTKRELGIHNKS